MRRAPESRRVWRRRQAIVTFFSFHLLFFFFWTRIPKDRVKDTILISQTSRDVQNSSRYLLDVWKTRPPIASVIFQTLLYRLRFSPLRREEPGGFSFIPNAISLLPFTTYATRSLPEAVDWVISAPLSVAICHDVYKSGLILKWYKLPRRSRNRARDSHSHALALAIPKGWLSLFFTLLARTHTRTHTLSLSITLNTLALLYQRDFL